MTSIYQHHLGEDFDRLHPMMQKRFGFSSQDGVAQVGSGTMETVSRGRLFTLPFLMLGSTRRILFPDYGTNVPFTVSNYAYVDSFGRETITWSRRYKLKRRYRCFDATMIYSEQRKAIVDYLGTHQHLAVVLDCFVDDDGGMNFRGADQRFYEHFIGFKFPRLFSGNAEVREWWNEEQDRYEISVRVTNKVFGDLFGYRGHFNLREFSCTRDEIPLDVMPIREERRE